jgi:hypothetical protein
VTEPRRPVSPTGPTRPSRRLLASVDRCAGLVRELVACQEEKRTGALHVECGTAHAYVYFRAGVAVSAEEGTLGESLGRILLAKGTLDDAQYRAVIERMTSSLVGDEDMRFGEVAVGLGFLGADEVREALADQVKRRILRCITWDKQAWAFHDSPSWLEGVGRFPTRIEPIVLTATRGGLGDERTSAVLAPWLVRFPCLTPEHAREAADRFGLDASELRLLESLDGQRTVAECLSGEHFEVAFPILAALVLADAVPLLPTKRPPRFQVAEHLVRARKSLKPRPLTPAPAPKHDLPPPSRRPTPPPISTRAEAERSFLVGKEHLDAGRFDRALAFLRDATAGRPDALEYAVFAGWAELNTDLPAPTREAVTKRLKRDAAKAVQQDQKFSYGLYVLGHLAHREGQAELAERYFRAATRLDPKNVDAERHVRILERRRLAKKR